MTVALYTSDQEQGCTSEWGGGGGGRGVMIILQWSRRHRIARMDSMHVPKQMGILQILRHDRMAGIHNGT